MDWMAKRRAVGLWHTVMERGEAEGSDTVSSVQSGSMIHTHDVSVGAVLVRMLYEFSHFDDINI